MAGRPSGVGSLRNIRPHKLVIYAANNYQRLMSLETTVAGKPRITREPGDDGYPLSGAKPIRILAPS